MYGSFKHVSLLNKILLLFSGRKVDYASVWKIQLKESVTGAGRQKPSHHIRRCQPYVANSMVPGILTFLTYVAEFNLTCLLDFAICSRVFFITCLKFAQIVITYRLK